MIFPELAVNGYPVEDMALRESFAEASRTTVDKLAARLGGQDGADIAAFVGYLDRDDAGPRNAAAVLFGGRTSARQFKHHLSNYGVFDERRYFVPGTVLHVVRLHGVEIGMVICEDMWQDGGPIAALGAAGVDLIVALNASPYERGKDDVRRKLVARRAIEARTPIVYVNMVGGQDELVFDGGSMVVGADGSPVTGAPRFAEHLHVVDIELPPAGRVAGEPGPGIEVRRTVLSERGAGRPRTAGTPAARACPTEEVWSALELGLADYARKNGFRSAVLGLSGGIDSAVVAALAVDALGAGNVYGVSMPSGYSSGHSRDDAAGLADRTGLHYQVQPIDGMVAAFVAQPGLTGLAEENVQSRCRALILMGLSNMDGHLVLATGNKSELAVGYSTIYGDAAGGFAPIKDILKTQVWQLARWRNAAAVGRGERAPFPELDRQAAVGRVASRTARHRLAAGLPLARPHARPLRRRRPGLRPTADTGLRSTTDPTDPAHGRQGRVQAAPVPAGHEDEPQGVRARPSPADHQPMARAGTALSRVCPGRGARGSVLLAGSVRSCHTAAGGTAARAPRWPRSCSCHPGGC